MIELTEAQYDALRSLMTSTEGSAEPASAQDVADTLTWVTMSVEHRERYPVAAAATSLAELVELGFSLEIEPGRYRATDAAYDWENARFEAKLARMRERVKAGFGPFDDED